MRIGPLLRREFVVAIGRATLFRDRLQAAALAGVVVVACLGVWDWNEWDRASVAGAAALARVAFGLVVAVQVCLAAGFVLPAARTIAAERDNKTLDALLATRLSSLEIVGGVMAAGFSRSTNALAATVPVVVLLVYLGGVDPGFALLAGVGLVSTAVGVVALAVVASVESRTAAHASRISALFFHAWLALPASLLMLRGLFLPGLPGWVIAPVLWVLDSSPMGLAMSLLGVTPRPWGFVAGVARMASMQVAAAVVLTAWAAWRLRPASRSLYDIEGRRGVLQALRAANRALPRRRPCGDDPVLWNERIGYRVKTRAGRLSSRLVLLTMMGLLGVGTWWFAAPAFAELAERGFGPAPEAYRMPELSPLGRVIAGHLVLHASLPAEPGQARLEFNIALRQFSAMVGLGFVIATLGFAGEGVTRERQRDTWLGLLATPLSGWEIVRGKALGAVWRGRGTAATLVGLWAIGLGSGAVHPLGFLAGVGWLAVSAPLHGLLGVSTALRPDTPERVLNPVNWPSTLVKCLAGLTLTTVVPIVFVSTALFTYEDIEAVVHSGPYPPFDGWALQAWVGARAILLIWLAGMAALVVWTSAVARSLARDFDTLVGRPCRPQPGQTKWNAGPAPEVIPRGTGP